MGLVGSGTVAAGATGLTSVVVTTSANWKPGGFRMLLAVIAAGGRSGTICSMVLPMWMPENNKQNVISRSYIGSNATHMKL